MDGGAWYATVRGLAKSQTQRTFSLSALPLSPRTVHPMGFISTNIVSFRLVSHANNPLDLYINPSLLPRL